MLGCFYRYVIHWKINVMFFTLLDITVKSKICSVSNRVRNSFQYSKTLIRLLLNLVLRSSYHDIRNVLTQYYKYRWYCIQNFKLKLGNFSICIWQFCDFNINTIDGFGTLHQIAGINVSSLQNQLLIPKETRMRLSQLSEIKGTVAYWWSQWT